MSAIVFYSWQSDLPNSSNRGFIQTALENAARTIRNDHTIQVEPSIDRDTVGVPGTPEISGTILAKIERSQAFVCDVSTIGRVLLQGKATEPRPVPNPNVLLELGYAIRALGWERVIMVLNLHFGTLDDLPFDLRKRRVLAYTMPKDAEDRATERKRLETALEQALRTVFTASNQRMVAQEMQRRQVLLQKLRQKFILSHDGISSGMLAGLEPLPKEWVDGELAALGEDWRQEVYR